jgi:spermidine dehydrogenase
MGKDLQSKRDQELGMGCPISRRDFLQGVAVGTAGALTGSLLDGCQRSAPPAAASSASAAPAVAPQDSASYYPPTLTGLRGSHVGSFEAAHALRDGAAIADVADTGEHYDLVVVGAGISGLAAAHFYRQRQPNARILLIDNHDDFGGHAKRNEFDLGGRLALMNGGTFEIDSPRPYGPVADGLLRTLGIDAAALAKSIQHPEFYQQLGLTSSAYFDRETFGAEKLVTGIGGWRDDAAKVAAALNAAPLTPKAKSDFKRVLAGDRDYWPGLTAAEKKDKLSRMSYQDYLKEVVTADPAVIAFFQPRTHGEWGVGIDAVSALDCWGFGMPGFKGLKLPKGTIRRMGFTPAGYEETGGSVVLHFPDGNATIARALVRNLIPAAAPGTSIEDLVTSRVAYQELDRPNGPVRLRLSATAFKVENDGDPATARGVRVVYSRFGKLSRVTAGGCVLAGYNMMIPYLCPELPAEQKAALHSLVKTPLVYTSVAIRNWQAFKKLGIYGTYAPGGYHTYFYLNQTVDIGDYRSARSPDEPILVHMVRTPCKPGLPEHEQNKIGRQELLETPFSTFERNIREQLGRVLGPGGFDPAQDITAITVNRWPHGYAPEYNPLFDPDVPENERAYVRGRVPFGRITIANSDSGGGAYTNVAIEQGYRAVGELLPT